MECIAKPKLIKLENCSESLLSLKAESYLRTSHIAQPASKTPPRNMAKQYKP